MSQTGKNDYIDKMLDELSEKLTLLKEYIRPEKDKDARREGLRKIDMILREIERIKALPESTTEEEIS